MSTLKEINLIHSTKAAAESEKAKLSVKTPVYVYEVDGHDGKTWFVIERHSTYAIGALYQKQYGIKANGVAISAKPSKEDVVAFMRNMSKEEIQALLQD